MTGGLPSGLVVVDASVAIKWHVPEVYSEAALRLLDRDAPGLHAPDLLHPEVGNILWKKVRRGELDAERGREIVRLLAVAPLRIHPSGALLEAAYDIAGETGRTVYDSLYLALAVHLDGRLVTADEKSLNALRDGPLGGHLAWVEDDLTGGAR